MEKTTLTESLYRLMRNLRRGRSDERRPSRSYMRVLRLLSRQNRQSVRELSEAMDVRPSSLSELLDRLEKDRAISREKDPADMRITRVCLTDAGKEILRKHHHRRWTEDMNLEKLLNEEEQHVFKAICDKLSRALEETYQTEKDRQT